MQGKARGCVRGVSKKHMPEIHVMSNRLYFGNDLRSRPARGRWVDICAIAVRCFLLYNPVARCLSHAKCVDVNLMTLTVVRGCPFESVGDSVEGRLLTLRPTCYANLPSTLRTTPNPADVTQATESLPRASAHVPPKRMVSSSPSALTARLLRFIWPK